ncbi:vWA domain-containing protein [Saccharospirillum impatiens]|uniref:vWA domain-containing protein n=1 Tax=Saccharospirillum impatiens TaxID=169438 RepID=UPI0012F9A2D6|nr:vWA domain-containing protein [Saccharospirillum impatiens]
MSTTLTLPAVQTDDATATEMRLKLLVFHLGADGVLINAVLVPKDKAGTFASAVSSAVNPNNTVRSGSTLVSTSESFAVQAGSDKADFLFVVDDSGSMSDEQDALSQAAQDFVAVINNSGFDYSIGVITTGYDSVLTQHDTDFPKLLTPAEGSDGLTELENRLVAGTGGSSTETGIYNAETTLSAGGDAADEGMPRQNSSLSVILLSDEESQYERRSTDGVAFDVANNVFVTEGYTFHSIVEPYDAEDSQYDDLSNETSGLVADIENLLSFEQFMTDIADAAGAISSQFGLSQEPITTSIVVTNNGATVPRSLSNGWSINEGSTRIVFHGTELPAAGDEIVVSYRYAG